MLVARNSRSKAFVTAMNLCALVNAGRCSCFAACRDDGRYVLLKSKKKNKYTFRRIGGLLRQLDRGPRPYLVWRRQNEKLTLARNNTYFSRRSGLVETRSPPLARRGRMPSSPSVNSTTPA